MSFLAQLKKVKDFIHHSVIVVSDVFAQLFGHDAAVAFGHGAMGVLKTALGVIVADAVHYVESLNPAADGAAKRAAAVDKIKVDAKAQGISVSDSIIHMLIELAVGVIKGNFAPKA